MVNLLAACGQTGSLYLPGDKEKPSKAVEGKSQDTKPQETEGKAESKDNNTND